MRQRLVPRTACDGGRRTGVLSVPLADVTGPGVVRWVGPCGGDARGVFVDRNVYPPELANAFGNLQRSILPRTWIDVLPWNRWAAADTEPLLEQTEIAVELPGQADESELVNAVLRYVDELFVGD